MKIAVWDTYVKREDGKMMHFDILVPDSQKIKQEIVEFGNQYLKTKPFKTYQLTANECRYCHIEQASEDMISTIKTHGFFIIEMENCQ